MPNTRWIWKEVDEKLERRAGEADPSTQRVIQFREKNSHLFKIAIFLWIFGFGGYRRYLNLLAEAERVKRVERAERADNDTE